MAGRHGNKGVVGQDPAAGGHAVPAGRDAGRHHPQPAGRAFRMNIGQILETHLGWALRAGSSTAACRSRPRPRSSTAPTKEQIKEELEQAGLPTTARRSCYDGRTGEPFDREITVGYIYMLKLAPPGRGQDPRPLDRPIQPDHPAAAGRQGAVRRPALRRDGGLGARGLRRRATSSRRC